MSAASGHTQMHDEPLPLHVRLLNLVGGGLDRIGAGPSLDAASIFAHAMGRHPLLDLGEPEVREPLEVLVASLNADSGLSHFGRMFARGYLQNIVQRRVTFAERRIDVRHAPDNMRSPPIFVIGLPRTGTTVLHNLLSLARGARALRAWEMLGTSKRLLRSGKPRTESDWLTRGIVAWINYTTPGLKRVHYLNADNYEECTLLLMNSLVSLGFLLLGRLDTYADWYFDRGQAHLAASYRLHQAQLRMYAGDEAFDHWVLKAPTHLAGLRALLDTYPTAQIVLTERDPAAAIPSTCSLFSVTRRLFAEKFDPASVGPELGDVLGRAIERSAALRSEFADRIFPVRYSELIAQPVETVGRLYERMGRKIDPVMDAAIRRWLQRNPQHKHGVHRYDESAFGLDVEAWRRRFGDAYDALFETAPAAKI